MSNHRANLEQLLDKKTVRIASAAKAFHKRPENGDFVGVAEKCEDLFLLGAEPWSKHMKTMGVELVSPR